MRAPRLRTVLEYLLTIALVLVLVSLAMSAPLPVDIVVDDPRNFPARVLAYTTIVGGRCILTFTPESVKRPEIVAHERCHCLLDADVIGPYGYEGITYEEQLRREARVGQCAKARR